ncbi:ComGF family competence protein [Bacillus sp. RG28]|uniref:ComGF family competence protein n=1 Tax=Gottfriedia endophytica TaxID=2820819 RepID=A0A940NPC5_9BACI|nr:competence type IV pilus minor pilin ComGF [Gottfriedia endophytica]MBP0724492.1 ComGF family competence protein [Gottfriedia endophytica]
MRKIKFAQLSRNDSGFTLLETIITFSLLVIIVSISSSSLHPFIQNNIKNDSLNALEWENFIFKLQNDINTGIRVTVSLHRLEVEAADHSISSYEQYQQIIRRQKNGTGHDIALQNIKDLQIYPLSFALLTIKVTDLKGVTYERNLNVYSTIKTS